MWFDKLAFVGLILNLIGLIVLFFYKIPNKMNSNRVKSNMAKTDVNELIHFSQHQTVFYIGLTLIALSIIAQLFSIIYS